MDLFIRDLQDSTSALGSQNREREAPGTSLLKMWEGFYWLHQRYHGTKSGEQEYIKEEIEKTREVLGSLFISIVEFASAINLDLEDCIYDSWEKIKKDDRKRRRKIGKKGRARTYSGGW